MSVCLSVCLSMLLLTLTTLAGLLFTSVIAKKCDGIYIEENRKWKVFTIQKDQK